MKFKEEYVDIEKSAKIFFIIEKTLSTRPNTQIFVDDKIYRELLRNGSEYNVYRHDYKKSFHYECDEDGLGGERWLSLHVENIFSEEIAKASFISNSNGYMQIVEFRSKKIKEYIHFIAGFEQLMLILAK